MRQPATSGVSKIDPIPSPLLRLFSFQRQSRGVQATFTQDVSSQHTSPSPRPQTTAEFCRWQLEKGSVQQAVVLDWHEATTTRGIGPTFQNKTTKNPPSARSIKRPLPLRDSSLVCQSLVCFTLTSQFITSPPIL